MWESSGTCLVEFKEYSMTYDIEFTYYFYPGEHGI